MGMNNGLDVAIFLIEDAKRLVREPEREADIHWKAYQDNLRAARRLLSCLYVDKPTLDKDKQQEFIASVFRQGK